MVQETFRYALAQANSDWHRVFGRQTYLSSGTALTNPFAMVQRDTTNSTMADMWDIQILSTSRVLIALVIVLYSIILIYWVQVLGGLLSSISAGLSFPVQLTMSSNPFQSTASSLITASLRTGQARDCIRIVLRHLSSRSLFSLAMAIDGDCTKRSKAKLVIYDSWYRVSSDRQKVSTAI